MSFHFGDHVFINSQNASVKLKANVSNDLFIHDLGNLTSTTKSPVANIPIVGAGVSITVEGTELCGHVEITYDDRIGTPVGAGPQVYIAWNKPKKYAPYVFITECSLANDEVPEPVNAFITATTDYFSIDFDQGIEYEGTKHKAFNYFVVDRSG